MSEEQDRTAKIKDLFDRARQLPTAEQPAFVRAACRGVFDGDLIEDEVLALLAELAEADGFLEAPTAGAAAMGVAMITDPSQGEGVGSEIGRYTLLEQIGEGGFGLVYMAEQDKPLRRRVALKIIKLGMDTTQVIARFEQERQALAVMDHPHIAKVLDAGATPAGRPYFVMELVRGEPITTFCDARRLGIPERLALFVQVCHAVQHAHQKGIIHRDIKPSNVLVTIGDGDTPVPKVIDFGIAKATQSRLTEKTLFTEFRQLIGTPEYMSPEQAGMGAAGGLDIDTRSDVYSLGVLLYELLTGVTPFDAARLRSAAFGELQRIIREDDPPRPSTRLSTLATLGDVADKRRVEANRLGTLVRGELDWVVMKCLEKDRTRRYASADDLAKDLGRHLKQEPLEAGPPTASYRVRKFVLRHRRPVAAGVVLAGSLILGMAGTSMAAAWALKERNRSAESERRAIDERSRAEGAATAETVARQQADRSAAEASRLAYRMGISSAIAALESGNIQLAAASLQDCPEELRGWEWEHLSWVADPALTMFETPPGADAFAGSPDGRTLVTRFPNGEILLFDSATGNLLDRFLSPAGPSRSVNSIELDPTSRHLIVGQRDAGSSGLISIIDVSSRQTIWKLEGTGLGAFADSGRLVVASVPGGVAVLETTTGNEMDFIPVAGAPPTALFGGVGPTIPIIIGVSGYEHLVYSLSERRRVAMYNTEDNALSLDEPVMNYLSMDQSMLNRMDLATGAVSAHPVADWPWIGSMDSLGHGLLMMTTNDGRMRIVSSADGGINLIANFPRTIRAWKPKYDGRTIFTIDSLGIVRSRSIALGEQPFVVATPDRKAYSARVSPSADWTAVTGWGEVRLYDTRTGEHLWSSYYTTDKLFASAFSPDGRLLAVAGAERRVALLDTRDGRVVALLPINRPGVVTVLAWSPCGGRLIAGLFEGDLVEWDIHNPADLPIVWKNAHSTAVADIVFSKDGRLVATASAFDLELPDFWSRAPSGKSEAVLWEASTRTRLRAIAESNTGYRRLAFAPGDASIAVATTGTLTIHHLSAGQDQVAGSFDRTLALAFSPDGSRLAASVGGSELRVLDPRNLSKIATLTASSWMRADLGFTPDGATLVMATPLIPVTAWERGPPPYPERRWLASRASKLINPMFNDEQEIAQRVVQRIEENMSPDDPLTHAAIAATLARGNNPNRIINIAALALRISTHTPERFSELAELAAIGVEAAPEMSWGWSTLALAEYRAGRFEEALAAARQSLRVFGAEPAGGPASVWAVIAMASHHLGRTEEAAEAMQRALNQLELAGATASRHTHILVSEAKTTISVD